MKIWNKTRMPILSTCIQSTIGSPHHSNQTRKRNKRYPNQKGRGKIVTICRGHATIYRKSKRLHTKTTRTDKFSKVAEYKINIQKSVVFLYTNEISERGSKKTIPFKIASKK